jgi:hypothetical protein
MAADIAQQLAESSGRLAGSYFSSHTVLVHVPLEGSG